jgi:hypothetical protein
MSDSYKRKEPTALGGWVPPLPLLRCTDGTVEDPRKWPFERQVALFNELYGSKE